MAEEVLALPPWARLLGHELQQFGTSARAMLNMGRSSPPNSSHPPKRALFPPKSTRPPDRRESACGAALPIPFRLPKRRAAKPAPCERVRGGRGRHLPGDVWEALRTAVTAVETVSRHRHRCLAACRCMPVHAHTLRFVGREASEKKGEKREEGGERRERNRRVEMEGEVRSVGRETSGEEERGLMT